MFLILEKHTVAHGEDDYYKFVEYEPVGYLPTEEEAVDYLHAVQKKYNTDMAGHISNLRLLKKDWEKIQPKPIRKPYIPTKKFGLMKNADITAEMREERAFIRQQNVQIDRDYYRDLRQWDTTFEAIEQEYLKTNKPPKRKILHIQKICLLDSKNIPNEYPAAKDLMFLDDLIKEKR